MKVCSRCKKESPEEEFHDGPEKHLKDGSVIRYKKSHCKACHLLDTRESAERHPHTRLAHRYRISKEEAKHWYKKTMGFCEICGIEWQEGQKKLSIDHDHNTGKIRGILCSPCNSLLGYSYDSIDTLESAIDYLKRS